MLKNFIAFWTFSRFTLIVALAISAIAAWYSVIGLTAIFAGAVIPIIIMGSILEIAKITTTVWLHRHWKRASLAIKTYLTLAVVALACLTSMGIFGLLSKAHLEQNVVGGEVQSKVALLDEKIKTQRDNIEIARKALQQMDAQVDARLSRGESEAGAERAVQIRRQQAGERTKLQREIADAQKEITKLNEERAPIASQLRKVEAEVGPIKYIAALIYGDGADVNTLEKAVRWVIILIVVVFDPLAIVLILAANNSLRWEREGRLQLDNMPGIIDNKHLVTIQQFTDKDIEAFGVGKGEIWPFPEPIRKDQIPPQPMKFTDPGEHPSDRYEPVEEQKEVELPKPDILAPIKKIKKRIFKKKVEPVVDEQPVDTPAPANVDLNPQPQLKNVQQAEKTISTPVVIETENVTKAAQIFSAQDEYAILDGKKIQINALKELHPNMVVNGPITNDILFGVEFPKVAKTSDIYTRTDVIPHKVFKFNGQRWIELDKSRNTSYLQNLTYIQHLISKLDSGEIDPEILTDAEQDEISNYLKNTT